MSGKPSTPLVVIAGPTGSGKSDLAVRVAEVSAGEIVNYDSVQIYRGFDIGSAKPDGATRQRVPHHLFDIVNGDEDFNAADFASRAEAACLEILGRGHLPVLSGGTFFYLRALLSGLPEMPARNEELRRRIGTISSRPRGPYWLHSLLRRVDRVSGARIAPGDRHRVERALEVWFLSGRPISSFAGITSSSADEKPAIKIALQLERPELLARIARRTHAMFEGGLVEETRALLETFGADARPLSTIGYREAVAVIQGSMTTGEAIAETIRRTRGYAKRQMTWLRSERNVHWIDARDADNAFAEAMHIIEDQT